MGRVQLKTVKTRPGYLRPTRLVAWMYSAVVLGCPATTISPSRCTSTPTETMFVARQHVEGPLGQILEVAPLGHLLALGLVLGIEADLQMIEHFGDVGRVLAGGQFVDRVKLNAVSAHADPSCPGESARRHRRAAACRRVPASS